MRAAVTFAALFAGAYAAAVTETIWDVTTKTVTVRPGEVPTTSAEATPTTTSSVHVEIQSTPEAQVQPASPPQVQVSVQPQPQPQQSAALPDVGSILNGLDPYKSAVLAAHNVHRAAHGVGPLTWSTELESLAQEQANGCVWGHQTNLGGNVYGQNIAAGVSPTDISTVIDGLFYNNEESAFTPYYGQASPSGFSNWGHFTQLVWKATTEVGCVTTMCGSGLAGMSLPGMQPFYTVCNYSPAGNMEGEYANNVFPPQS